MSDEKSVLKQRFKERGADLGALLGELETQQEGEEIRFNAMVYFKRENDLIDIYEGDMVLRSCGSGSEGWHSYRLSSPGHFTTAIPELGKWSLGNISHFASGRTDLGPFLYALMKRDPEAVLIQSKK